MINRSPGCNGDYGGKAVNNSEKPSTIVDNSVQPENTRGTAKRLWLLYFLLALGVVVVAIGVILVLM